MLADRRVKIVATIGPAIRERESLNQAIHAGMNVARLNFSHGSHQDHLSVIKNLRELSLQLAAPIAILQDLQGPKIRVGKIKGGSIELVEGETLTLTTEDLLGEKKSSQDILIPTDFKELPKSVSVGQKILLDDGLLELKVLGVKGTEVRCEVVYGGTLKDRKGVNIPGATLPIEALTEKDLKDLEFGLEHKVDYVALSFVRRGDDVRKLRQLIEAKNPTTRIIAKIEMLEALEHLEEIIALSDGVMVARGDLAIEVGQSQLPAVQKRIIRLANAAKKPVITATQMLDSMIENPRPTRAEITDIANAVIDGSDALMLSAETASGKYPFKCLRTMHEIVVEVEKASELYWDISLQDEKMDIPEAIAASACLTALKIQAAAIVCLTTTGRTASLIASFRPKSYIVAITHNLEALNRLELNWGIQTFSIKPYQSSEEALVQIEDLLIKMGLIKKGDKVVVTMGTPVAERAKTNSLRIYTASKNKIAVKDDTLPLRCRRELKLNF